MNTKKLTTIFILIGIAVFVGLATFFGVSLSKEVVPREPITFSESGSYVEMSLNDVIYEADTIVLGEIETTFPSEWNTQNGKLPDDATWQTVSDQNLYIFTEQVFRVSKFLKGEQTDSSLIVRTFGGQVGQDIMTLAVEKTMSLGKPIYCSYIIIPDWLMARIWGLI